MDYVLILKSDNLFISLKISRLHNILETSYLLSWIRDILMNEIDKRLGTMSHVLKSDNLDDQLSLFDFQVLFCFRVAPDSLEVPVSEYLL